MIGNDTLLDSLRRNWTYAQDGLCKVLGENWPECIPAAKETWLNDPGNRRQWIAAGGE